MAFNLKKPTDAEIDRIVGDLYKKKPKRKRLAHTSSTRVLRMSTMVHSQSRNGIQQVRASKPLWQKSMQKHYYQAHVREPDITTRTDEQEATEHNQLLAKGDAKDAYGERKLPMQRTKLERIALYR